MEPAIQRIFLAVPAPPEIISCLKRLKEINHAIPGIKWMREYNVHLTVYFIGNIKKENIESLEKAVRPIIESQSKFTLKFEKVCFAPLQKPRMIWIRFRKNDAFTQLNSAIHDSLRPFILQDKFYYKEPVPHITLARFHPIKDIEKIDVSVNPKLSQLTINSCELWESFPSPEGVHYQNIAPVYYLSGYNFS